MARRSTSQKKIDDAAFPVRVRNVVPGYGFGPDLIAMRRWLSNEIGEADHAGHGASVTGMDACALHFRDLSTARSFMAAIPELELADGTATLTYSSPAAPFGRDDQEDADICNLYSLTRSQDAMRQLFDGLKDRTGNLPALPGIFPDMSAPIVRDGPEGRELVIARWGMPSPAFALRNRKTDTGVTNVRNTESSHWRRWLGVKHRCLVPFTSFCEYEMLGNGGRVPVWFALDDNRPLAFFAGIWTEWTSVRKVKEGETTNQLFAFLTTDANAVVAPVHPKAMPVILTTMDEYDAWLTAPAEEAMALQRPIPDDALRIVARGERSDPRQE